MTRSVSPASVAVRAIIHQIGILLKNRSAAGLKNVVAKAGTSNHNSRGSALQLGRTASPLVARERNGSTQVPVRIENVSQQMASVCPPTRLRGIIGHRRVQ
jgi:hypothetical protein